MSSRNVLDLHRGRRGGRRCPFGLLVLARSSLKARCGSRPIGRGRPDAGIAHVVRVATVLLAVVLAGPAGAGELIRNGSFETGDFGPYWVHGSYLRNRQGQNYADHVVRPDMPFSGNYSALLGFKYTTQQTNSGGYMYQQVSIPSNISSAMLYFKVRMQGYDSTPYDPFYAQIRRTNGSVWRTILTLTFPEYNYIFKDSGWLDDDGGLPVGYDMTSFAGSTCRVYFEQANTIDALYETWSFVDDVSLVYKRFVDLAVDAHGDDLFGALGTGLGGESYRTGTAGDSVFFDLTVENEGTDSDIYVLSAAAPSGWTVRLDTGTGIVPLPFTTRAFAPQDVEEWKVVVVAPPGASTGSYGVVVDAVSASHSNRYDSVRLGVNIVEAEYGTDLVVDGNGFGVIGENGGGGFALKTAAWDSTVSYTIELENTGGVSSQYRVSFAAEPNVVATVWYRGVPYTTPFNTQVIEADSAAVMTLLASVPYPQPGGDYETIVRASAAADTLKKDSIRALLRLRAPRIDMIIGANGDGIYDDTSSGLGGSSTNAGERGTMVLFPVLVENESAVADSFTVTWQSPGGGWTAVLFDGAVDRALPFNTPAIPANSLREYVLKISVPGGASYQTYASYLNAVSRTDNRVAESVTAAVSVTSAGQVDMVIDGSGLGVYGPVGTGLGGSSTRTAAPGDSAVFTIDLRNVSGTNSIDVYWSTPPGWRVTFDGRPSPVNGQPAGVYEFKVVVPPSAPSGTVSIIVDARKTDKPFYMDSVIGRVNVYRPRAVDVVIDGNGNGIYGPLGTGLGGTSAQSHSAPAVLNFTVETQNEGLEDDAYTVTWNQIPFWQARLAGSASPHATGVVPAGSYAISTFAVTVPPNALPGDYVYIINFVSNTDPDVVESVEARVTVVGPPRADLVIDGNGAGLFGSLGSGEGGVSLHASAPGDSFTSTLEVRNAGSFADSFTVFWEPPAGWPAGSVIVNDGTSDRPGPFWTLLIGPGASRTYTVKVRIPVDAGLGVFSAFINSQSSLPPQSPESVRLITLTSAVVTGVVFDDRDHNGAFGPGDTGIGGVSVRETASGSVFVTGGDGRYVLQVPGGVAVTVVERNLSGFISLTPDTVAAPAMSPGDTLTVDFADVPAVRLSSGTVSNGVAGAYVDFPHRLDAGTKGAVVLTASADSAVVTMFFLDENEDGEFNGADRTLEPADLDMDPAAGRDHVCVLLRAFVPMTSPPGTTHRIEIVAVQSIEGTALTSRAEAFDAVVVVEGTSGLMTLHKQVDNGSAAPGDVLTYTIEFANTGTDSVQKIVILDPISVFVDPLSDAFGPGMDIEWRRPGSPDVYLTLAPGDGDECDYAASERLLRLDLSRNSPYVLAPGEHGTFTYRVIVK